MSVVQEWSSPPPRPGGPGRPPTVWTEATLADLRARPGVWAYLGEVGSSTARAGRRTHGLDVVQREVVGHRGRTWARVPVPDPDDAQVDTA